MPTPTIADMLKYANLQMAAEALYNFRAKATPNQSPGDIASTTGHFSGEIDPAWLTLGNEHATRFAPTEAAKFASDWIVKDHISNTKTGFSGTLYQAVRDDPTQGIKKGEYVISIRSTEFIDDASNPLLDQKVENFNFTSLVGAFDAARTANPSLTSWALTNALTSFQLAGSDTAAMGGDLAYQYGKSGTLAGIGVTPALNTLSDTNLGTNPQALNSLSSLQTGSVRLS